jgi:hypothetical protein
MMTKQDILNRLDFRAYYISQLPSLKPNGSNRGQALCPFHDDSKPSLSVDFETGQFKCFGCEKKGSIFDFYMERCGVGFKEAKEALAKDAGIVIEAQRRIVQTYDYKDESGKLLFQTVRYEPKDFMQRRPDGKGGWMYKLSDTRLVPYNLPEVLTARSVIIVEGEKDVEALRPWGLTATCNPMGAGKWRPEYNEHFRGKRVAIIPDNDEPGRKHSQTVARTLKETAESVKVLELPGLPKRGDVSDLIAKGGTKESLIGLIKQAQEWEPNRSFIVKVESILSQDAEPITWGVADLLPEGGLILLTAPPSHFKTFLSLDMARCVSQGLPFLGRNTKQKPVLYIEKENPRVVLKSYLEKLGISPTAPLEVWPSWTEEEPPMFPNDVYLELARERPLMIFDSLIRFYPKGTDENSSTDIREVIGFLRSLTKAGATVLVLHHKGKGDGSDYRGSSDILGGVDMAYTIKKPETGSTLTIKCLKSRYSMEKDFPVEVISDPDGESIRFEDATQKIAQAREQEEHEKMETIKGIIHGLDNPNQGQIIERAKKLEISKNETLRLLSRGEDKFWASETEGRGRPIHYRSLGGTFPPFHDIYSAGKPERLDEPQNAHENDVIEVMEVLE